MRGTFIDQPLCPRPLPGSKDPFHEEVSPQKQTMNEPIDRETPSAPPRIKRSNPHTRITLNTSIQHRAGRGCNKNTSPRPRAPPRTTGPPPWPRPSTGPPRKGTCGRCAGWWSSTAWTLPARTRRATTARRPCFARRARTTPRCVHTGGLGLGLALRDTVCVWIGAPVPCLVLLPFLKPTPE